MVPIGLGGSRECSLPSTALTLAKNALLVEENRKECAEPQDRNVNRLGLRPIGIDLESYSVLLNGRIQFSCTHDF